MNENGNCPACNIIAAESEGPRQILVTDHYIALSPWASTYPHEFWIYPKRHITSFSKISQREISDLALILRSTLGGMYRVLNKPSYNIVFYLSPDKKYIVGNSLECRSISSIKFMVWFRKGVW